jgi:hypothetical protein
MMESQTSLTQKGDSGILPHFTVHGHMYFPLSSRTFSSKAGLTLGEAWQYDKIQPAAPLLVDSKANDRQERVWGAVLTALRGDVPKLDGLKNLYVGVAFLERVSVCQCTYVFVELNCTERPKHLNIGYVG